MTTPVTVPPVSFGGTVTPPPVNYSGSVAPPALQLDLSPTGPYKAAILGSTGSDGSAWQVAGTPAPVPTPTPVPSTSWSSGVVYDLYGAPVRTDAYVGLGYGAHEAPIDLNPGYDWAKGARPGQFSPGSNQCATFWGQFFEAVTAWPSSAGGSPAAGSNVGVRLQVRDAEVWTTSSPTDPNWKKIESLPGIGGGTFDYNFYGGGPGFGSFRSEPSGGQSFAFVPGYINHIWDGNWPRPLNVPGPSYVFHVRAQVRLITDSSTVNLAAAKIVGGVANDWYPNTTATAVVAGGIGIPRCRYVTPAWQWFTYTGMTQAQMTANMPPVPVQPLS